MQKSGSGSSLLGHHLRVSNSHKETCAYPKLQSYQPSSLVSNSSSDPASCQTIPKGGIGSRHHPYASFCGCKGKEKSQGKARFSYARITSVKTQLSSPRAVPASRTPDHSSSDSRSLTQSLREPPLLVPQLHNYRKTRLGGR